MAISFRLDSLLHRARIGRFASVGVIGATLETAVVAVLAGAFGISPLLAKAAGAELSISTMFVINDRWTFANEGRSDAGSSIRRWQKSHCVRIVGLTVAFATLYVLTSVVAITLVFKGFDVWPVVANTIGIGVGMTINYVAECLFTWNVLEGASDV
ncbi:GtrA family protein [Haloarcula salina]|uniref:GtrA family protein n=1 Tax=Haloarcula salina TaxID=1429914 RepID=A0AA41KKC8_9EURY|nr:GtrA family protein [Haloarcula salina]MBV0901749.1 GtrA family protein [Haloarcula salina]